MKIETIVVTVTAIPVIAPILASGSIEISPASAAISGAIVACIKQAQRNYLAWVGSIFSSSMAGIFLGPSICARIGATTPPDNLAAHFVCGLCGGLLIELATLIASRTIRNQIPQPIPLATPPTSPQSGDSGKSSG